MDILIKGMEMPKGNDYLHLIIQGGKVHTAISCGHLTTDKLNVADAIEVKPHGRLIDADALIEKTRMWSLVRGDEYFELRVNNAIVKELLDAVPTIVEANNGSDN